MRKEVEVRYIYFTSLEQRNENATRHPLFSMGTTLGSWRRTNWNTNQKQSHPWGWRVPRRTPYNSKCLCWIHVAQLFQVMQVAYGIATSTEVAYFTYIYAKISGEHYRLVCIQKQTIFNHELNYWGPFGPRAIWVQAGNLGLPRNHVENTLEKL